MTHLHASGCFACSSSACGCSNLGYGACKVIVDEPDWLLCRPRVADNLAAQLATSPGLPSRGGAALSAELRVAMRRNGHCYLPWGQLSQAAENTLLQTGAHALSNAGLVAAGMPEYRDTYARSSAQRSWWSLILVDTSLESLCICHSDFCFAGRPWPEDASLEQVAQEMHAKGDLVAELDSASFLGGHYWPTALSVTSSSSMYAWRVARP